MKREEFNRISEAVFLYRPEALTAGDLFTLVAHWTDAVRAGTAKLPEGVTVPEFDVLDAL